MKTKMKFNFILSLVSILMLALGFGLLLPVAGYAEEELPSFAIVENNNPGYDTSWNFASDIPIEVASGLVGNVWNIDKPEDKRNWDYILIDGKSLTEREQEGTLSADSFARISVLHRADLGIAVLNFAVNADTNLAWNHIHTIELKTGFRLYSPQNGGDSVGNDGWSQNDFNNFTPVAELKEDVILFKDEGTANKSWRRMLQQNEGAAWQTGNYAPAENALQVSSQPSKTQYRIGDQFDPTGMTVSVLYHGKAERDTVAVTAEMVKSYDFSAKGSATVVLSYAGVEFTCDVQVLEDTRFDIGSYTFEQIEPQVYTGNPIEPEITVAGLEEGDYSVTYSFNINAGFAEATVEAVNMEKCKGSQTLSFEILKAEQIFDGTVEAVGKGGSFIELKTYEGAEYSIDGVNWQNSPRFENLQKNTEYTFYIRLKGDANHNPSEPESAKISTTSPAFTVHFETNGGADIPDVYADSGEKLEEAVSERPGYRIVGWYREETFETVWDFEQDTVTGNMTLYAKWEIVEYELVYDMNGYEYEGLNLPSKYTVEDEIVFELPEEEGYSFTWNPARIEKGTTGKRTVYLRREAIVYNINFDLKGGSVAEGNPTVYTIEDEFTFAVLPQKAGYIGSWDISGITAGMTGDITVTAQYEAVEYKIKYHMNGGKNAQENPEEYTVENGTLNLVAPTKEGYVFVGWYADAGFTEKVESIDCSRCTDLDLYAKFEKEEPAAAGGCNSILHGTFFGAALGIGMAAVVLVRKKKRG